MATKPQIDSWEASSAADTLARAEAIKANKPLHEAAKGSAAATIAKMQSVVNTPSTAPAKATAMKPKAKAPAQKVASAKPQIAKVGGKNAKAVKG